MIMKIVRVSHGSDLVNDLAKMVENNIYNHIVITVASELENVLRQAVKKWSSAFYFQKFKTTPPPGIDHL